MTDWSLYLVTDPVLGGGRDRVIPVVEQAVAGGVTVVQLRDKDASDAEITVTARALLGVLGEVPLFLNDRVGVARELGCHLHIGQNDLPYEQARELLGPEQMIGLSIGSDAELDAVVNLAANGVRPPDVLGIGPVRDTATKTDAPAGLGVNQVSALAARAKSAGVASVGIGGIDATVASDLARTDVAGICVVSAIMAAVDPAAAAHELKESFHR